MWDTWTDEYSNGWVSHFIGDAHYLTLFNDNGHIVSVVNGASSVVDGVTTY